MTTPRAYVFLDRDGTLVEDPGYVCQIEDYALRPGVLEGLAVLRDAGFRLAIVTNQSGIGRGYFSVHDFERFQTHLIDDLAGRGFHIDATFYCPHTPADHCRCRKPETELLERARRSLWADLPRSWVIGDAVSDVELATRAGCRSVHLVPRDGPIRPAPTPPPTLVAHDLAEAADRIVRCR